MQWSRPRRVRERTFCLPRRSSLATSVPSMLTSGVTFPSWRSRRALFSVMSWPLVKSWKKQSGCWAKRSKRSGWNHLLPPRMPKKLLPCSRASLMTRFRASRSILTWGLSTSTQHPWQRRLQELRTEM